MVPFERALVSSYKPSIHIIPLSEIFDCSFEWRLQTPNFGEGKTIRKGSGMVPLERALVSFYRLSIVTFPLALRVSEILWLWFSSMQLFPYPSSSLPKISQCSPGNRQVDRLLATKGMIFLLTSLQHLLCPLSENV